jgi:V8-like Glu-specific endopeptidase
VPLLEESINPAMKVISPEDPAMSFRRRLHSCGVIGVICIIICITFTVMSLVILFPTLAPTLYGPYLTTRTMSMAESVKDHKDPLLFSSILNSNFQLIKTNLRIHQRHQQQQDEDEPRIDQRRRLTLDGTVNANTTNNISNNKPNIAAIGAVQPRIIGGQPVIVDGESSIDHLRFPYYVALRNSNNEHICGGTLIAPDIVLTAAHCL